MAEERPQRPQDQPDEQLRRPDDELKDLQAPPETADDVRGGWWKKVE